MIDHTIRTQDKRQTWQFVSYIHGLGYTPRLSVLRWRPSLLWRIKHWMGWV